MSKNLSLLRSGILALTAAALVAPAAHADVKGGVDAWSAGDYDAAIRQWQPLAAGGDPDAEFNLAQAYKLGRGVPMDLGKAEDLYGKAAAKGHTQAADSYGLLLFQRGERTRALPYIEASAARGDARAQYILGIAHFNGDMVKKDWVRAYALVSLAQQEGLSQATNALAQMDQHIPLTDRQKSVSLGAEIAAQAKANRLRLNTSAELGTQLASAPPGHTPAPEIVEPQSAVTQATRVAGTTPPSAAGADYVRAAATPTQSRPMVTTKAEAPKPAPARTAAPASPVAAKPPAAMPKPKPVPAANGPWRVQLGAFGVASNAEALWAKVKGRPEMAGHAKALTPAGKLLKLQATGFASKTDADAACSRLSASGFMCLPVRD
ncbi:MULTISPECIES: SPOR domain-containing protein [unclassified Novosphingobium]|uniref:SPOR domain-containing protein n=1 Tax=unclassified Novosphingobium TaxID=2644732 RepID=UPI00135C85DC|nr:MULTISPECIES: SPOR domain-containing protein [unclassified Novosphingobium]